MTPVGLLIDELFFLHQPYKCDGCTYFDIHFKVQSYSDSSKNGCGHFYMLLYDNFVPKSLPRACLHDNFKNKNSHNK